MKVCRFWLECCTKSATIFVIGISTSQSRLIASDLQALNSPVSHDERLRLFRSRICFTMGSTIIWNMHFLWMN